MRHEIVWTETASVVSPAVRTHDAIGVAFPEGSAMRDAPDRLYVVGRGTVNGKPFCAGHVFDATASFRQRDFWAFGYRVSDFEHHAVRRSMEKLAASEPAADAPTGPLAEIRLQRTWINASKAWLDVPWNMREEAKDLGATWDGGAALWHTMVGVDPAPFEDIGARCRVAPEWRRIAGADRGHRDALKGLGCRWIGDDWYVDVATARGGALDELRDGLGLRIMETIDDLYDWRTVNGWNARPEPDAFPEWENAPATAGPRP